MKSKIFIPLLSGDAINNHQFDKQNFSKLQSSSPCDNVLLEYILALELHDRGLISKIYPVFIGNQHNSNIGNYFHDECHPSLKGKVIVKSVIEKLAFHLDLAGLGSSFIDKLSVSEILNTIISSQGIIIQGEVSKAFDAIALDVIKMLN